MTKMEQRRFNGLRRFFLVLLPIALLALLTVSLASPGLAHAQSNVGAGGGGGGNSSSSNCDGCSLVIGSSGQLVARTTVFLSATFVCTLPAGATFWDSYISVRLTQASGQQIIQSYGGIALTTCDGTVQTVQVAVTPTAGSSPFHGGPATVTGELFVDYIDSFGYFEQGYVDTAIQEISISG